MTISKIDWNSTPRSIVAIVAGAAVISFWEGFIVPSLERPNLFALGNPYPVGLGLVKIGQPIDDLEKAYVGAKIVKEDGYWTLNDFHSVFDSVAYYFDTSSPERKIKHLRLSSVPQAEFPWLAT